MARLFVGFLCLVAVFGLTVLAQRYQNHPEAMPEADGKTLHLYALPVGQGEALVLQCPSGDVTIIDLGSSAADEKGFWTTREIHNFLLGHFHRIKNIVITHNDQDHYSFFEKVFPTQHELSNLSTIHISCNMSAMDKNKSLGSLRNWIKNQTSTGSTRLQEFNGGRVCGSSHPNNHPCEAITLCPINPEIETKVLSANAGNCHKDLSNEDSIVIGIKFRDFSMQLNGDFRGVSQLKDMVDCYKKQLNVTVYKLAHHGAARKANTANMCDAVRPKAVFVSSNPWYTYGHPRCKVIDYFIGKDYLCQPAVIDSSNKSYCGGHPISDEVLHPDDRPQKEFACGLNSSYIRNETTNPYAIYSTTPSELKINLVHLLTDGTNWGFVNKIQPRIQTAERNRRSGEL